METLTFNAQQLPLSSKQQTYSKRDNETELATTLSKVRTQSNGVGRRGAARQWQRDARFGRRRMKVMDLVRRPSMRRIGMSLKKVSAQSTGTRTETSASQIPNDDKHVDRGASPLGSPKRETTF